MSSNGSGFGGLLGAALSLYVIHEILHDGRTGRKLGIVHARSKKHAVQILSRFKKLPDKVRVFKGKKVKGSKKKERHYAERKERVSTKPGYGFQIKVPRYI